MTKVIVSSQVKIKKNQNMAQKQIYYFIWVLPSHLKETLILFIRKPKQRKIDSHDGGSCFIAG